MHPPYNNSDTQNFFVLMKLGPSTIFKYTPQKLFHGLVYVRLNFVRISSKTDQLSYLFMYYILNY